MPDVITLKTIICFTKLIYKYPGDCSYFVNCRFYSIMVFEKNHFS
jgi:hypothetical protein